jgi:hypothetical protein
MERRGFLKGLFGGVTSAGLIIAAKPADIAAFTAPLATKEPLIIDSPAIDPAIGAGEHLYNSRGECVGIVTEVSIERENPMNSLFGQSGFVPGLPSFKIRAEGIGTVQRGPKGALELRGVKR